MVSPLSQIHRVLWWFGAAGGYPLRVHPDGRVGFCCCRFFLSAAPCLLKAVPLVAVAVYVGKEQVRVAVVALVALPTLVGSGVHRARLTGANVGWVRHA